eukprot:PhM_4_TR18694/c3_g1_i8/m.98731
MATFNTTLLVVIIAALLIAHFPTGITCAHYDDNVELQPGQMESFCGFNGKKWELLRGATEKWPCIPGAIPRFSQIFHATTTPDGRNLIVSEWVAMNIILIKNPTATNISKTSTQILLGFERPRVYWQKLPDVEGPFAIAGIFVLNHLYADRLSDAANPIVFGAAENYMFTLNLATQIKEIYAGVKTHRVHDGWLHPEVNCDLLVPIHMPINLFTTRRDVLYYSHMGEGIPVIRRIPKIHTLLTLEPIVNLQISGYGGILFVMTWYSGCIIKFDETTGAKLGYVGTDCTTDTFSVDPYNGVLDAPMSVDMTTKKMYIANREVKYVFEHDLVTGSTKIFAGNGNANTIYDPRNPPVVDDPKSIAVTATSAIRIDDYLFVVTLDVNAMSRIKLDPSLRNTGTNWPPYRTPTATSTLLDISFTEGMTPSSTAGSASPVPTQSKTFTISFGTESQSPTTTSSDTDTVSKHSFSVSMWRGRFLYTHPHTPTA